MKEGIPLKIFSVLTLLKERPLLRSGLNDSCPSVSRVLDKKQIDVTRRTNKPKPSMLSMKPLGNKQTEAARF